MCGAPKQGGALAGVTAVLALDLGLEDRAGGEQVGAQVAVEGRVVAAAQVTKTLVSRG